MRRLKIFQGYSNILYDHAVVDVRSERRLSTEPVWFFYLNQIRLRTLTVNVASADEGRHMTNSTLIQLLKRFALWHHSVLIDSPTVLQKHNAFRLKIQCRVTACTSPRRRVGRSSRFTHNEPAR